MPISRRRAVLVTGAALSMLAATVIRFSPEASAAGTLSYEAEDGVLNGTTVDTTAAGYSGTGYVNGFDTATDSVTITIPDSPGGLHDLSVRYRAPHGQKVASLQLNGAGLGDLTLTETTSFSTAAAGKVLLAAGDNTVTVLNNWGWYEIDAITVTPSDDRPPHQVTGALVNDAASAQARSLMRYLADNYGRHILSGQQDAASISWVEQNIGKAPAVGGFDLMDYSPSRVERGTTSREVENIIDWDARGGMATLCWHWNAPSGLIDTEGHEWWRGFYTDSTTFDVQAALADKTSADYQLLIRDIDAIAVQLQRLEDAGIPILWRPLHEAEGGWFWWGAKGPEPTKELWRILYDRITNIHHIDNLIWVWNSKSPAWYPGDDVVDVVSIDSYPPQGDHGAQSGAYDELVGLGSDRKLVALGEVGGIPDPDLLEAYQAHWSWFVTWSGSFVQDGTVNPRELLTKIYHHEYVITLDELGDFKNYPGSVPSPTASASPVSRTG
ncbi:glycosyl hydrolase [Plantactinospora sp. CA-290183]|uniref:glycosyl hydrolase n=1 Tax=Plantactinospora sp. CA-290183 TaxID=3240006 RepID=UPI003D92CBF3